MLGSRQREAASVGGHTFIFLVRLIRNPDRWTQGRSRTIPQMSLRREEFKERCVSTGAIGYCIRLWGLQGGRVSGLRRRARRPFHWIRGAGLRRRR